MPLPDRIFKALMRVMPAELRGDFERDLTATFRAERAEQRSSPGLTRLWLATIADVVRTALGEHLDILRRDLVRAPHARAKAGVDGHRAGHAGARHWRQHRDLLGGERRVVRGVAALRRGSARARRGTTRRPRSWYHGLPRSTLRAENASFASIAAFAGGSAVFGGDGKDAERVPAARVTWDYFNTLGLRLALGRDFEPDEDHPDRRRVAIISDALWQRRYGGDPSIIGRPVTINQVSHTLAGVTPPNMSELVTARKFPDSQVWTLLGYADTLPQACRSCRHIHVVGRLKDGMTTEQAEADLTRVYQSLATRLDRLRPPDGGRHARARLLRPSQAPVSAWERSDC